MRNAVEGYNSHTLSQACSNNHDSMKLHKDGRSKLSLGMEWKGKDAQLQQVCNQVSETQCVFEGPVGPYFEISSNELIKLIILLQIE